MMIVTFALFAAAIAAGLTVMTLTLLALVTGAATLAGRVMRAVVRTIRRPPPAPASSRRR